MLYILILQVLFEHFGKVVFNVVVKPLPSVFSKDLVMYSRLFPHVFFLKAGTSRTSTEWHLIRL
jgi:hypothetical protein